MSIVDAIQRGCAFAAAVADAFQGSPLPLSSSLTQARQQTMMGGRLDVGNTACVDVVADANYRGLFHHLGRKHDGDKEEEEDNQEIAWHLCHR